MFNAPHPPTDGATPTGVDGASGRERWLIDLHAKSIVAMPRQMTNNESQRAIAAEGSTAKKAAYGGRFTVDDGPPT